MFRKKILSSNEEQISLVYFWYIRIRIYLRKNILERFRKFKARRPHRSFKISRKIDYVRPLKIGGYWNLLGLVFKLIRDNKKIFRNLVLVSALAGIRAYKPLLTLLTVEISKAFLVKLAKLD